MLLLGGSASPTGWSVQFVEAGCAVVTKDLLRWRSHLYNRHGLWRRPKVRDGLRFPKDLVALEPYEAPWTREVLFPCGRWTAYLNNFINGGDGTASANVIANRLGVRHVMASHSPEYGPGHQATQLWISGPSGSPPRGQIRTIDAHAEDGRWAWHESGTPLPFEETERYAARQIRDRFDRDLLVRYLAALEIPVDDDSAYGPGVLVQENVTWQTRKVSREQMLADVQVSPQN